MKNITEITFEHCNDDEGTNIVNFKTNGKWKRFLSLHEFFQFIEENKDIHFIDPNFNLSLHFPDRIIREKTKNLKRSNKMRKIINGVIYDTEKAELIGNDCYGNPSDFRYYEECVYRTKKGNWFLYQSGGAMSCMRESVGSNTTSGSSDIITLTEDEAFEKLESMNEIKAIEKWFPEKIQEA